MVELPPLTLVAGGRRPSAAAACLEVIAVARMLLGHGVGVPGEVWSAIEGTLELAIEQLPSAAGVARLQPLRRAALSRRR